MKSSTLKLVVGTAMMSGSIGWVLGAASAGREKTSRAAKLVEQANEIIKLHNEFIQWLNNSNIVFDSSNEFQMEFLDKANFLNIASKAIID